METDCSPSKKVGFVEEIQVIGYSEPEIDAENERKILEHLRCKYDVHPKKLPHLFQDSQESESEAKPASKDFLSNLQNVMAKKLQVAEQVCIRNLIRSNFHCIQSIIIQWTGAQISLPSEPYIDGKKCKKVYPIS